MSEKRKAPLIVDYDAAFIQNMRIEAMSDPSGVVPFISSSMDEALGILQMHSRDISVLMVSTRLGRETVLNTVHAATRLVPGMPVMLISDTEGTPFTEAELRKMFVQAIMVKPFSYDDLLNMIMARPKPAEKKQTDADFAPIEADAMEAESVANEDVYLRIREDRYVKILKKGSKLGTERKDRYLQRGVKSFFKAK